MYVAASCTVYMYQVTNSTQIISKQHRLMYYLGIYLKYCISALPIGCHPAPVTHVCDSTHAWIQPVRDVHTPVPLLQKI